MTDVIATLPMGWCVRCYGQSNGQKKEPALFIYKGHGLCEDCLKVLPHSNGGLDWDYTIDGSKLK